MVINVFLFASMYALMSRPIWDRKRGLVNAVWARVMSSLNSPKRGNLAAIEIARCQSPKAAASFNVCSFVFINMTIASDLAAVQTV